MPKIKIENVPGLDGEYPLDLVFTHRDFRTIKQLAGVRANEVMDAVNAGDLDIVVAMAEIALQRAGKPHHVDQLWDAEAGSMILALDENEVDASPPLQEHEPNNSGANKSSGTATNGATATYPETLTLDNSGTRQPANT